MSCRLIYRRVGAYSITPSPHLPGNYVICLIVCLDYLQCLKALCCCKSSDFILPEISFFVEY